MRIAPSAAIALFILLAEAATAQVHQAPARSVVDAQKAELSTAEFKKAMESGDYQLIDVRTPAEFASGRIAGAVNIDWTADGFEKAFAAIKRDKPVLLYCLGGGHSEQALEHLVGLGYRAQHLEGGISAWRKAGHPVVK